MAGLAAKNGTPNSGTGTVAGASGTVPV